MVRDYLIIVSGLPRSGTSLLMQMLSAGGIPILYDLDRPPNNNNPLGYFEHKRIKNLPETKDVSWLESYKGHAVKIVSPILSQISIPFPAKIIFLLRPLPEVIMSQRNMIQNQDKLSIKLIESDKLQSIFEKHINQTLKILSQNPILEVLKIDFPKIFVDSEQIIKEIDKFLDGNLNKEGMRLSIHQNLYRNKI
ncbi:MAG TPA: hypothetical protein PLX23_12865 [Candidatus Hydrogenedens sp.]|nr:hypothetical protein [Candidatus Hydrogenedens sp.]